MKSLVLATAIVVAFASSATAVPVVAPYVELPTCDAHSITLSHELGNPPLVGPFPAGEAILSNALVIPHTGCQPTAGVSPGLPDWEVSIINVSGTSWVDLFFVADAGLLYNNVDGTILGGGAFKIDDVGDGVIPNEPLLFEIGGVPNLIFEPGELWIFFVLDWDPGVNGGPPSLFTSLGVGLGSIDLPSNASIVARQLEVPQPGGLLLLAVGLPWLLASRRRT